MPKEFSASNHTNDSIFDHKASEFTVRKELHTTDSECSVTCLVTDH